MPGEGMLQVVIWPVYAGAVLTTCNEPMSDPLYSRGQITWEVTKEFDHKLNEMVERIIGHARVYVPQGEWSYIIYTHHPTKPMFSYAQKLEHPLRIGDGTTNQGGWIDVQNITEDVLKNPGRLM